MHAVRIQNLSHSINNYTILKEISLELKRDNIACILGPSGCGKTTLLNCLSGLDEVSIGKVYIEGTSLFDGDDAIRTRIRREHLGFVFQAFNLIPVLTALENVEVPLQLNSTDTNAKQIREKALGALAAVGLEDWAAHRPSELSGGQQQRVTIARAFVHSPALLLADEPTGNLDSKTSDQIMELLCSLNREQGITMLVVTHDQEIADRCSRILHMQDGRIVSDMKTNEEE